MRLKADQNLPAVAIDLLRQAGHDVHTADEEGLSEADDPVIARAATEEGRALLTLDLDFADLRVYPPAQYAGIIVLRLHTDWLRNVGRVMTIILRHLDAEAEAIVGKLWIVDEMQVRIRPSSDEG